MKKMDTFTFISIVADREEQCRSVQITRDLSLFHRCNKLIAQNATLRMQRDIAVWLLAGILGAVSAGVATYYSTQVKFAHVEPAHVERSAQLPEADK